MKIWLTRLHRAFCPYANRSRDLWAGESKYVQRGLNVLSWCTLEATYLAIWGPPGFLLEKAIVGSCTMLKFIGCQLESHSTYLFLLQHSLPQGRLHESCHVKTQVEGISSIPPSPPYNDLEPPSYNEKLPTFLSTALTKSRPLIGDCKTRDLTSP